MTTKTLRVQLADILGPLGPGTTIRSGEVWARYVDGGGPRIIHYTDGTTVLPLPRRVPIPAGGVVDLLVVPSDDATVVVDDRGFGVEVGWSIKARGDHGGNVTLEGSKVVQVAAASPSPVLFGLLPPATPALPFGTYLTAAATEALVYGYSDHGNQSGTVAYDATIPTHALTMTGNTTVTLSGGADGRSVSVWATGAGTYSLTVEGTPVPTGECIAVKIRGVWKVRVVGGSGDVLAPSAGTLAGSAVTSSGFTLTVTGAADETALHTTPYAFSTDNGVTWSAWQASNVFAVTGAAAATTYTCKHKVRDANGNITTGAPISVTTGAPASWTTLYADTFAGTAGILHGRTTTTGSRTWARINTNDIAVDGAGIAKWDTHAQSADAQVANVATETRMRATLVYDVSTHTTGSSLATAGAGFTTNSGATNSVYANIACSTSGANATISLVDNAAGTWSIAAASGQALTGQPATGTMVVDIDVATLTGTVSINGTVVANITGTAGVTGLFGAQLHLQNSTAKADTFTVERFGT